MEIIVAIIAAILAGLLIYITFKKYGMRKVIIEFIVLAEKSFKQGRNDDKFNYLYEKVYNLLPAIVKFFVGQEELEDFIETVFSEVKIALDYKK
jgi:uncharacterized membrane protein YraQ (UPF0718 family)